MNAVNEVANEIGGVVEITDVAVLAMVSGGGDPIIIRPKNTVALVNGDPIIIKPF